MSPYELRDPIHQRIPFSEFEHAVIDHPFFQRLRFISQLGFITSYVYPGGVQDRFTHALGAMHVAGRLFSHMISESDLIAPYLTAEELNSLQIRVRMAGLLHDLGHGPFSHASEVVFPMVEDLPFEWSWWKNRPLRQAVHEDYSVLLIQTMAKEGLFDQEFARDVCSLIHKEITPSDYITNIAARIPGIHEILKGLISGEADCDRMDYLLRDSYYCGVAYGRYDIHWLISAMGIAQKDGKLIVSLSENGVRAFEDLLLARYHMIDQVYYHKTKAGFAHYLEEAIRQQEIQLEIPTDPYAYAYLRDGAVIELLFAAAKNEKNYWSSHLMRRIPARRILRVHASKQEDVGLLERLALFCDENDLGHFTHTASNKLSNLADGSSKQATMIYVAKKLVDGLDYIPIFRYSDLLQKYNEKLNFTDFFVRREDAKRFEQVKSNFL